MKIKKELFAHLQADGRVELFNKKFNDEYMGVYLGSFTATYEVNVPSESEIKQLQIEALNKEIKEKMAENENAIMILKDKIQKLTALESS